MLAVIMGFVTKVWTWVKVNIASLVGAVQAILKGLKELLTAIVNLLSIIAPASAAQRVVLAIRAFIEKIDAWIEGVKPSLIPVV